MIYFSAESCDEKESIIMMAGLVLKVNATGAEAAAVLCPVCHAYSPKFPKRFYHPCMDT